MLKDIAILTGGTYISSELNMNLPDTQITDLGTARQIKVTKDNTVIVDGAGDANEIKARIAEIKNTISVTTSDYDKEKLQEAVRRRCRHQGRRTDRSGHEGTEAPRRGRSERDPCGC